MTSSNAIREPATAVGVLAEPADAAVDATAEAAVAGSPVARAGTSPFEFLPAGEAFGVCDLDGECR